MQRGKIALQSLGDRLVVAAQAVRHPSTAAVHKIGVQRFEALEDRKRNEEVPSRITDEPLDFALVVALARPAKTTHLQMKPIQRLFALPADRLGLLVRFHLNCDRLFVARRIGNKIDP